MHSQPSGVESVGSQAPTSPVPKTVELPVEIPVELHLPLQEKWTWYAHVDGESNYSNSIVRLGTFGTLCEYLQYVNHVPAPHIIFDGAHACLITAQDGQKRYVNAYSLFRNSSTPAWEDATNIAGGTLLCRSTMAPEQLQNAWQQLCNWIIQEEIQGANGIRVVQKFDKRSGMFHKIEVWLQDDDESLVAGVQQKMRDMDASLTFQFMPHNVEKNTPRHGHHHMGKKRQGRFA